MLKKILLSVFALFLFSATACAYQTFAVLEIQWVACAGCGEGLTGLTGQSVSGGFGLSAQESCGTMVAGSAVNGPATVAAGNTFTTGAADLVPNDIYFICLKLKPKTNISFTGGQSMGTLSSACLSTCCGSGGNWPHFDLLDSTCVAGSTYPSKAYLSSSENLVFAFPFFS